MTICTAKPIYANLNAKNIDSNENRVNFAGKSYIYLYNTIVKMLVCYCVFDYANAGWYGSLGVMDKKKIKNNSE